MRDNSWVDRVLRDEGLTRGLGDEEARVLIEWLVAKAELMARALPAVLDLEMDRLCRRGRSISRFVALWSQRRTQGAALQLVAAERFSWPLPENGIEPGLLMEEILAWEDHSDEQRRAA